MNILENNFDVIISISTLYHLEHDQLNIILDKIIKKMKCDGVMLCNFIPTDSVLFSKEKERIDDKSTYLFKKQSWITHKKINEHEGVDTEITCCFFEQEELKNIFRKYFSTVKVVKEKIPAFMSLEDSEEKTDSLFWVMAKK